MPEVEFVTWTGCKPQPVAIVPAGPAGLSVEIETVAVIVVGSSPAVVSGSACTVSVQPEMTSVVTA
jgi:hypothetical protein